MKLTATHGVIAMKGSGKTYRAMAEAEGMLEAGGQVVAIDPTGAWWGLRFGPDGKRVRFPQLLVLGANGSLPLSDSMGEAVAALVVSQRISAVLDLSDMSKAGMRRFVAAFMLHLYRVNPNRPLHTFVDEADLFAPERAQGDAANSVGAMSDYFRRGRRKGLGGTLITQRVQAIAKDVLWQCEAMTILRLKGTHDIKAVKDWLDSNGYEARAITAALPKLHKGDCYLCEGEHATLVPRADTKRGTFDSSRTPEPGDDEFKPPTLDDKALEAIKAQLGEAAAELEANDPKALKAEVARLRRELAATGNRQPAVETKVKTVEVPILDDVSRSFLENYRDTLNHAAKVFDERLHSGEQVLTSLLDKRTYAIKTLNQAQALRNPARPVNPDAVAVRREPAAASSNAGDLPKANRLILTALAQHGALDRVRLAVLTGYKHSGGGFNNAIGALRSAGHIEGPGDSLQITQAGADALGSWQPLPSGRALVEHWQGRLGKAERCILDTLYASGNGGLSKEDIASATGYAANGGGFGNALGKLRTLGLIEGRDNITIHQDARD